LPLTDEATGTGDNHRHQDLLLGPGPRGGIALVRASRALAFVQGRDFVIPDDVKRLLIPALSHRFRVTPEAEIENVTPEAIINRIATEVPIPREERLGQTEEAGRAAEEMAAAETAAPEEMPGQTEETVAAAREPLAQTADIVSENAAVEAEPAPAAETEAPGTSAAEPLSKIKEVLRKVEFPSRIMPDWEWILVLIALVIAAVMISVGILSLR